MLNLATITADVFRPHLGSHFDVALPEGESLELTLLETTEAEAARPGHRRGFALTFGGGSMSRILPQATYTLHHAQLGEFELFIVPRQPQANEPRYEAVFN